MSFGVFVFAVNCGGKSLNSIFISQSQAVIKAAIFFGVALKFRH